MNDNFLPNGKASKRIIEIYKDFLIKENKKGNPKFLNSMERSIASIYKYLDEQADKIK